MSKKPIVGGIILASIIGVVFAGAQINPDNPENEDSNSEVWHIRMAGPEWDDRQSHRAALPNLEEGTYKIGFVAMGDSPHKIELTIKGKWTESYNVEPSWRQVFSEEFVLEKSLVDTGISKYYTWEYIGQKYVQIPELEGKIPSSDEAIYEIIINRSGNLEGSVSISLSKVDTSI